MKNVPLKFSFYKYHPLKWLWKKGLRKHLVKFQCQPEPPDSRRQASRLVKGKIARNLIKFEKQRSDYSRGRTAHHFISKVNIIVLLFTFYILPLLLKYPCMARISDVYSSLIFKNRATSNHQKCTRNFPFRSNISLSEPKKSLYIFLVENFLFFPFHVNIRNNCVACPTPYWRTTSGDREE